jgi:hypothetical protein
MMRIKWVMVIFMVFGAAWAYCGGLTEENLVNVQEINVNGVNNIEVSYRWERISLFSGTTDTLIIKEYMSRDNSRYYAVVSNVDGKLTVTRGRRPWGILINTFDVRVEVYLPVSYRNAVTIKATSGKIDAAGELICGNIAIENSSGDILLNAVTTESARFKTRSGRIAAGPVSGEVSAESSSGRIELDMAGGALTAKATSGSIRCTVSENTGGISLTTSSGSVTLNVPQTLGFNFSSRTSSGSVSTPFPGKLFSPVSDRHTVQGVVNSESAEAVPAINIRTTSGSVRVRWLE